MLYIFTHFNFLVQFCSTRKSTQQAAEILVKDIGSTYIKTYFQRQALQTCANTLKDNKLRGEIIHILNDYQKKYPLLMFVCCKREL